MMSLASMRPKHRAWAFLLETLFILLPRIQVIIWPLYAFIQLILILLFTGRNYPTTGTLVALNREEFILEVSAPHGLIRVHFPRVGFTVKADKSPKL